MFKVRFYKRNRHVNEYVYVASRTMPEQIFYEFYSNSDYEIVNFHSESGCTLVNLRYDESDGDVPNRFLDAV